MISKISIQIIYNFNKLLLDKLFVYFKFIIVILNVLNTNILVFGDFEVNLNKLAFLRFKQIMSSTLNL